MKAATAIGIIVALLSIVIGGFLEGTQPMSLFNLPALIIIFPTTLGICIAACGMDTVKLVPTLYKKAMSPEPLELGAKVTELVSYAEKARKDGLLALEEEIEQIGDEYTRRGMQLVVDGTDPDLLAEILESDTEAMHARHKHNWGVFEKAGGYAPTIGVLGTVVGLIHVLGNLSAPETLGPSIAAAFIATLYGVGSANVVYLPVGNRLQALSEEEVHGRTLVLEGILAIQSGDNPRVVQEKLLAFLPPSERAAVAEGEAKPKLTAVDGGAGAAEAQAA